MAFSTVGLHFPSIENVSLHAKFSIFIFLSFVVSFISWAIFRNVQIILTLFSIFSRLAFLFGHSTLSDEHCFARSMAVSFREMCGSSYTFFGSLIQISYEYISFWIMWSDDIHEWNEVWNISLSKIVINKVREVEIIDNVIDSSKS